jgi:hypothetical protein
MFFQRGHVFLLIFSNQSSRDKEALFEREVTYGTVLAVSGMGICTVLSTHTHGAVFVQKVF